jgi:hypothetical protein
MRWKEKEAETRGEKRYVSALFWKVPLISLE